jgi:hypothetical protein
MQPHRCEQRRSKTMNIATSTAPRRAVPLAAFGGYDRQPNPCGICGDPDHTTAYHPLPEDPALATICEACE